MEGRVKEIVVYIVAAFMRLIFVFYLAPMYQAMFGNQFNEESKDTLLLEVRSTVVYTVLYSAIFTV